MVQTLWFIRDKVLSFVRDERGQDVFEYVLIIGAVSVAVLAAIVTPIGHNLIASIVNAVCTAIGAILTGVSCSTPV